VAAVVHGARRRHQRQDPLKFNSSKSCSSSESNSSSFSAQLAERFKCSRRASLRHGNDEGGTGPVYAGLARLFRILRNDSDSNRHLRQASRSVASERKSALGDDQRGAQAALRDRLSGRGHRRAAAETGASSLEVVANGIPSPAVSITVN
jgi:hypothetical protein